MMDVLKLPLIWIDQRCYRTILSQDSTPLPSEDYYEPRSSVDRPSERPEGRSTNVQRMKIQEDPADDEDSDSANCAQDIVKRKDGYYELSINIPTALCGIVVGTRGATRISIESDTGTKILVPNHKEGLTVINGLTRHAVEKARVRIIELAAVARGRHPCTHFLSIPLTGNDINDRFHEFKQKALEASKTDQRMNENIFQHPAKLHLTIGVMVLLNDVERKKAAEVLQECTNAVREALHNEPLVIKVKGLEIMNDDASAVDVLYAKVSSMDGSNRLQLVADLLVEHFVKADLVRIERDKVKLHATLINSAFMRRGKLDNKYNKRQVFDARYILKELGDYDFGVRQIDAIHLSRRHTTDRDGYYVPSATFQLQATTVKYTTQNTFVEEITKTDKRFSTGASEADICEIKQGLFELKMNIPANHCGLIIGKMFCIRDEIEKETRTNLFIPRHSEGTTSIQGRNRHDVEAAYKQILSILRTRYPGYVG